MTVVRFAKVNVSLGRTAVLNRADWRVPRHPGLTVLRGPSGAGKTTVLHLLSGLIVPRGLRRGPGQRSVGTVCSFPANHSSRAHRAHLPGLPPRPGTERYENVALPLWLRSVPMAETRAKARAALQAVGLAALVHRLPDELSGGEQQRVAIARGIATEPDLILADEPTANLDDASAERIGELLRAQGAAGRAVIVATHDRRLIGAEDLVFDVSDGMVGAA